MASGQVKMLPISPVDFQDVFHIKHVGGCYSFGLDSSKTKEVYFDRFFHFICCFSRENYF